MANLIIKPNSATGDKLILQDRAGGAVLTTADSGATIANATLNSPTMVTPALGTPASGNLGNSAIVYPAGHVIQVKTHVIDSASNSSTTTGSSFTNVSGFPVSFTPKKASGESTIVFCFTATSYCQQGWAQCMAHLYDATTSAVIGGETSMTRLDMQSNRSQQVYARWSTRLEVVFDSWGASAHSLYVRYKSSNSQTGRFNDGGAKWTCDIWEIMK